VCDITGSKKERNTYLSYTISQLDVQWRNLKERDHLEDLGFRSKDNIKKNLK
jgi:hypothetical protein